MTYTAPPQVRRIGPPSSRYGGFRNSLLLRLAPADIPEDDAIFGPLARQMALSPPMAQVDQLVDLIESELSTINARVEESWRGRVVGAIAMDVDLDLHVDQLELDAYVAFAREGNGATVSLSLGTVFALDDLSLFALTSNDVLIPDRPALSVGDPDMRFEVPESLNLAGAGLDREGRFFDYRGVLDHGIDRPALTHAMAFTPWRLAQASLLSELAIAFVLFHERAHWGLGHLDLLRKAGLHEARLSETRQTCVDGLLLGATSRRDSGKLLQPGTHRAMEAQADTQAFFLLCDYAMRVGGALDRYEAVAESFGIPDDPRVLHRMTFGRGLRLCITALSLACIVIDEAEGGKGAPESPTHPKPATRLMSMVVNSPIISPMTRQDAEGHWVLAVEDRTDEFGNDSIDFGELTGIGIGMALTDLLIVSSAVDADFIPLELNEKSETGWGPSEWLRDLTKFWIAQGVDEGPCTTPAGLEMERLLPIDKVLARRLAPLQRRRFGALLQLDVSEMWAGRPPTDKRPRTQ